jgi:hypothetical protein
LENAVFQIDGGALAYHWTNLAAIWLAVGAALALSAIVAVTIHL